MQVDPLAQLVEHNTFNVGVSGSSPERVTKEKEVTRGFLILCKVISIIVCKCDFFL